MMKLCECAFVKHTGDTKRGKGVFAKTLLLKGTVLDLAYEDCQFVPLADFTLFPDLVKNLSYEAEFDGYIICPKDFTNPPH